jgi:hypothetical protein
MTTHGQDAHDPRVRARRPRSQEGVVKDGSIPSRNLSSKRASGALIGTPNPSSARPARARQAGAWRSVGQAGTHARCHRSGFGLKRGQPEFPPLFPRVNKAPPSPLPCKSPHFFVISGPNGHNSRPQGLLYVYKTGQFRPNAGLPALNRSFGRHDGKAPAARHSVTTRNHTNQKGESA